MNGKPEWTKAGHRSLKHNGWPRMVVRFGKGGAAKPKLLISEREFYEHEHAAGRVPEQSMAALVYQAAARWAALQTEGKA